MAENNITYEEVIARLKSGSNGDSKQYIDKNTGNLMLSLNDADIYELRMLCSRSVQSIDPLNEEIKYTLQIIETKYNNKYHQLVWKISGLVKPLKMLEGYSRLLADCPVLRTNYVKNILSVDVAVTYEATGCIFPITDISEMSEQKQAQKIVNTAAAESRREYFPEKSPVLRIQAFILKKDLMAVIVSFIPHLSKNIERQLLMSYVFDGMHIEGDSYSRLSIAANSMNDRLRKENILYWQKQAANLGKEMFVPGEQTIFPKTGNSKLSSSISKKIDSALYKKLCLYSAQKGVQKKSILLYAWSYLMGSFHNEKVTSLAVLGNNDEPSLYPVTVDRNESLEMAIHMIEKQWEKVKKYNYLETDDYEKAFSPEFSGHFHFQHRFLDVENMLASGELTMLSGAQGGVQNGLTINYNIFKEECRINYIYYSDCFYDDAIENLHSMYIYFLEETLAGEINVFDKTKFISQNESTEERNRKIAIAQKGLILHESGLFGLCSAAELIEMAGKSIQQNCVVDEELISAGTKVESIGIVSSGMIEESITDKNGFVKSLRVLSKGNIFGIEAILEETDASCTYTVASENSSIIWIKKEDLIDLFNLRPDLWRELLSYEHSVLGKMQKVWAME